MTKLVIQIPAYNEAQILPVTLSEIPREYPGVDEVILVVIDDGSTDNTANVALKNGADLVVRHRLNRGLSKTFITGIQTALSLGADIIVNTDADNQYPGSEISRLIAPILDNSSDLVIGDRKPLLNSNFSQTKGFLESFGSWVVRRVSGTNVADAPSGFRAYSRYAALRLQVHNPYSYTIETLIQAGRERMKIVDIPIPTNQTTRPSKLHKGFLHFIWNQGGAIIRSYILYQPLKTFLSLGVIFLGIGLFFILRFFFFYLIGDSGVGRYIQSVSIGGTLSIFGFMLIILGFLGEAVRVNRQVLEETLIHLRSQTKIENIRHVREINGEPVYTPENTLNLIDNE